MPLTSRFTVNVFADLVAALDLANAQATLNKTYLTTLANGIAAGMADRVFHDKRTLAPSANEDLDLAGALLDAVGGPFVLARVKGLLVRAYDTNANSVVVGAAAATPWATLLGATHTLTLRPGTLLAAFAGAADATGYAVGAGASDLLRVTNGGAGTSVDYDIIILGCSA